MEPRRPTPLALRDVDVDPNRRGCLRTRAPERGSSTRRCAECAHHLLDDIGFGASATFGGAVLSTREHCVSHDEISAAAYGNGAGQSAAGASMGASCKDTKSRPR